MGDEVESTSGNGAIARSGYTIGHLEHHMVPTSETQDQPQVSTPKVHPNARACDICRQMKVKCDGFDNPPCVRCTKSGRACVFQFSSRARPQVQDNGPLRKRARYGESQRFTQCRSPTVEVASSLQSAIPGRSLPSSSLLTRNDGSQNCKVIDGGQKSRSDASNVRRDANQNTELVVGVPSVYFVSPLDSVRESNDGYHDGQTVPPAIDETSPSRPRGDEDVLGFPSDTPNSGGAGLSLTDISKRDLRSMIQMFRTKLLPNISVLSPNDFQDADHLISTDLPLVYCICYVTAGFLSGGKRLRELLKPTVSQILTGKFTSRRHPVVDISTLKGLVILYSYAGCSSPTPPSVSEIEKSQPESFLYWPLKSLVEVYGLRLSLHRSLYDLQAELQSGAALPITETLSYQKYTLWLQLFTMAKYCSSMTGTPPSIPIDSTIRAAPIIMDRIGMNPQACLFGEVELSLIWEKVGSHRQLEEWWCERDPSTMTNENETNSILRDADQLIDTWYHRWDGFINGENERGGILAYLGRCARFSIHRHATRSLQPSITVLSTLQKKQIQTCVYHAGRVLDWPLDLSPIQKDSLRYISESGGIMVSFCCLFIVASCQAFRSRIPDLSESLEKVKATARLMLEMAPNSDHSIYRQGLLIARRIDALRHDTGDDGGQRSTVLPFVESLIRNSADNLEYATDVAMNQIYDFGMSSEGAAAMDALWDFSMLTPNFNDEFG